MQKEKSTRRFPRRSYSRVFSSFFEETLIPKKDLCRNYKADMDYAKSIENLLFCKICDRWYCSRCTRFHFPDREVFISTVCSILRPNNEM
jgi:hypothetical protein